MKQIDTLNQIRDIVLNINTDHVHGIGNGVIPEHRLDPSGMTSHQMYNALHTFAYGCQKKDVCALCDTTIMQSGKQGILFSTEGFYYDSINRMRMDDPIAQPVLYKELQSVLDGDIPGTFVLLYKNGHFERCFGGIYTSFLIEVLSSILQEVFDCKPQDELKTETLKTVPSPVIENTSDHHPLIHGHTSIPDVHQVSMFNSTPFVVLQKKKCSTWKRMFYELTIRELNSSVISSITIGWDTAQQHPTYVSEFLSPVSHTGFERIEKEDMVIYKYLAENYLYPVLDCKLVLVMYEGNTIVKELVSGRRYGLEETPLTLKELKQIHKGDILLVCLYQNKKYLVCSYMMENYDEAFYKGDGTYIQISSREPVTLQYPTYLYENKHFIRKEPQEGVYYRVLTTKGANVIANTEYPHISNNFTFLKPIPVETRYMFVRKDPHAAYTYHFYDVFSQTEILIENKGLLDSLVEANKAYTFCKLVCNEKTEEVLEFTIYPQVEKLEHVKYIETENQMVYFRKQNGNSILKVPYYFINQSLPKLSVHTLYSCYDSSLLNTYPEGLLFFLDN